MFENLMNIFKKNKKSKSLTTSSKDTAKERLHLVLMQDRANVSADFLDLMRKEIIEVIKKYIDIDEKAMDVRLTTDTNEDGTQGAPALYANIPIINIKDETRKISKTGQDHKIEIKLTKDKIEKEEKEEKEEIENQDNKPENNDTEISEKELKEETTNNDEDNNEEQVLKDEEQDIEEEKKEIKETNELVTKNKEEEDNNNEE